jgi:hypothetical protein
VDRDDRRRAHGVGHVHSFLTWFWCDTRGAADDDAAAQRLHGLALAAEVQRVELVPSSVSALRPWS